RVDHLPPVAGAGVQHGVGDLGLLGDTHRPFEQRGVVDGVGGVAPAGVDEGGVGCLTVVAVGEGGVQVEWPVATAFDETGDRRREAVGDAGGDLADRHGRSVSLAGAGQVDGAGTVGAPGVEADGFEAGGDGVVVVDGVEVVDGE